MCAAQVLCDLVCVYDALVRSAVAVPELPPTIRATPADAPAAFANAVQVRAGECCASPCVMPPHNWLPAMPAAADGIGRGLWGVDEVALAYM